MSIDWREESIHKTNKPPSDAECDGHRKQNDTTKAKQILVMHQVNKNVSRNFHGFILGGCRIEDISHFHVEQKCEPLISTILVMHQ